MKIFLRPVVTLFALAFLAVASFPQREVGTPIKKQEAFVTEFRVPYQQISVDIGQNNFIETESLILPINAETKIVNKKGKTIDRTLIRPGVQIEITGERFNNRFEISNIRVLTDLEKWEVEIKGYFESLEGDKAWIDGQAVKLSSGTLIRGTNDWKGKTFASFNDMQLGSQIKINGMSRADGIIYATGGEANRNEFSKGDRKMLTMVAANMLIPSNLAGGKGKVAGREVTFSNDLELQKYINKVGNRLVPQYEKDLPADYPGKIVFRFFVIEDESFNAFALPDGSVFVHTGLLKQIKTEAQLASILGHEITHVTYEHGRKQFEGNEKREWLAIGALIGGRMLGSQEAALAGLVAVQTLQNHYGRQEEDQADRVGLYYMSQTGYDPREAPKVWREISKNTKQDAVSNFLYSDHSTARARLKNLNREIAYNYYDTDLSSAKAGKDEYMNVVGVYFGWIPRPTPKAVALPTVPKNGAGSKGRKPPPAAATPSPVSSIIAFVVKQTNQPGSHLTGDIYADITLENFQYIVSLKTGRVIKKTKSALKSFSGDYADISINTMNARMKDTGQGGGWLLKKSGNTWQIVAIAEGDWSCDSLKSVPASVRKELGIECF